MVGSNFQHSSDTHLPISNLEIFLGSKAIFLGVLQRVNGSVMTEGIFLFVSHLDGKQYTMLLSDIMIKDIQTCTNLLAMSL